MDLNILKYLAFVKTAFYGSFTRAAEHLNYSQSGVSRMVNDLERECGMPLLIRSRSGITLTAEGTALLPYAKALCREYKIFLCRLWICKEPKPGSSASAQYPVLQRTGFLM